MGLRYQTVRFLAVWFTAVAVLIAGLPYTQCRCANGNIKLFCFGFSSPVDCCSVSTLPEPSAQALPKPACCCRTPHETTGSQDGSARFVRAGCQKTLTQSSLITSAPAQDGAGDVVSVCSFVLPSALPAGPAAQGRACQPFCRSRVLPPTDRVIAHLHLVI